MNVAYLALLMDLPGWGPKAESLDHLDACDSKLEQMAALGLLYYAEVAWATIGYGMPPAWESSRGVEFVDPWMMFPDQIGPGEMWIRPQVEVDGLTRDFVVGYDCGDRVIVEVDGYAIHRRRRRSDWMRDVNASAPTLRFAEELEHPVEWPARLLWPWEERCTHCGVNLGGHSCPPF